MTLIGLAYNQKPEPSELASPLPSGGRQQDGELPRPDEEPPSISLGLTTAQLIARDEFAEWDSPTTISAVESALSRLGKVVRLEAKEDFPERLRQTKPDIVFNIAEGFYGVNREAHVPAICEFYGIPYSGSDPFTLSLCLDKARTKESLSFHGIPTPRFAVVADIGELQGRTADLRLPLFEKPLHEGSSK
jgi:D-alanine-D-alanine ligase